MGAGIARQCREHAQRIRALCGELLAGDTVRRLAAFDGLIMLAPGERDLVEFLLAARQADSSKQFVYSLRLDIAVHAVRELAFEISKAQELHWTSDQVYSHLNLLVFGLGQGDFGIAGRLYDSDRYRRSRRTCTECELIDLLDEALQRKDDSLRNEAFRRLWQWAADLCRRRCNDDEAAQDLASEAIVHLLKSVRPDVVAPWNHTPWESAPVRVSSLFLSGVETLSRVYVALFGYRKEAGGWPGLFDKYFADRSALREVSWDRSTSELLHAPLHEVANRTSVALPREQIRSALSICREDLESKQGDGIIGERSAQALSVILDYVHSRMVDGQTRDGKAMFVASIRLRPQIEAQTMQPYLAKALRIQRPSSQLRRLLAVQDILIEAQLFDRDLVPLAIREQDLPAILARIRNQVTDSQFRKQPRQRRTLTALADFWGQCELTRDDGDGDCPLVCLPPLVTWSRRVHVQTDVLQLLNERLGMGSTAGHNCVKRQLQLLESWGFVREDSDGRGTRGSL